MLIPLLVRCEGCGAAPKLRLLAAQAARWNEEDPAAPVMTYQCNHEVRGRRRCGTIMTLTAGDFQNAYRRATMQRPAA